MAKKTASMVISFILLIAVLQGQPFPVHAAPKETAKILNDTLNIRKGPGLSYGIEAIARKNEAYSVIERKGDWVKLALPGNRTGWAASWLVQVQSSSQEDAIYSNAEDVRIRKGPGKQYPIIGTFPMGKKAKLVSRKGDWTSIAYEGTAGWISSQYASSNKKEEKSVSRSGLTGYITASSLYVRSAPAGESTLLGSVKKGTAVTILNTQSNWLRISYGGETGWVNREFVQTERINEVSGIVSADSLNVRQSASLNGTVSGKVRKNEKVIILEKKNGWAHIRFDRNQTGWVSALYIQKADTEKSAHNRSGTNKTIKLVSNGTNIRSSASVNSSVIARGTADTTYPVLSIQNDWYKISLPDGRTGYVAGWLAEDAESGKRISRPGESKSLKGKTIVIDPGHGGIDGGTAGSNGTLEKSLTMKTARYLEAALESEGANVISTRSSDLYISLQSRVRTSHLRAADAFISLHYDSSSSQTVRGMTVYYYHTPGRSLAAEVNDGLIRSTASKNRGVRFGDYHVIRENTRPAILIELGYLSSVTDEMTVNSNSFQQSAVRGITEGLNKYFSHE
ncbi:SH3 domain-containing protein [Bacillus sp. FJAT-42376]|uniref:SH3 domain-containing protein n=1 Tax=Bacillus sp. FJAT-42376 TaxID=2014076 RepID=UPI0013DE419B|nr:SH3 domain-containing protein [Bacillus sp. FJAT-42376]